MFRNCEIVAQSSGHLKGLAGDTSTSPLFYEVILSWTLFDQNMPIWWGRKTRELGEKPWNQIKVLVGGLKRVGKPLCRVIPRYATSNEWESIFRLNASYTQIKKERFTGTVYWNEVSYNSVHAENVYWSEKAFVTVMLYSYRDTELALENFLWTKHELQSFSYRLKSSLQGEPGNKGPDGDLVSACYFIRSSSR